MDIDLTWFRRFGEPPRPAPRLYCFPHAGGAASAFAPLARALAGRLDVVAVQYPGRQDRRREAPATGIVDLAEQIAGALDATDGTTGQPFALLGHSMGALVAYETARVLQRRSTREPMHLFFSPGGAHRRRARTDTTDSTTTRRSWPPYARSEAPMPPCSIPRNWWRWCCRRCAPTTEHSGRTTGCRVPR